MKRNAHTMHKILLLMIGVLSIVLAAALVLKAYEFHQDKLQREEWEVRHVEVQAEVDDVRMKIEELAEDKDALQAFLDENINIEEVINMEETSGTEETEPGNAEEAAQGDTEEAKPGNTEESNGQQEEENPQGQEAMPLWWKTRGLLRILLRRMRTGRAWKALFLSARMNRQ